MRPSPMRRALVGAATALATSVVLLAGTGAASAATLTLHDGTHDMWGGAPSARLADYVPARHRTVGDVRMARLRYGPHDVVLVERFARLRRSGAGDMYAFKLHAPHVHRFVEVQAWRHSWAGSVTMTRPNGHELDCTGLTERIDYTHNLLRVIVPTGCLGTPPWVQFGVLDAHITRGDRWLVDNPQSNQATYHRLSSRVYGGPQG